MNKPISLLILFGGVSSEHDVSCVSASSVLKHIDTNKYDIKTIGITKDGKWYLTTATADEIADRSWENHPDNVKAILSPDREMKGILTGNGEVISVDVVFPVLHGKNGEDGTMQGLLQLADLPFVGPGATASAASMDKAVTKAIIAQAEVAQQAKCCVVHNKGYVPEEVTEAVDTFFMGEYPVFVKPANAGSSVGISKVKSVAEIPAALEKAFAEDDKVVIEEGIIGREIEVAVLGNEDPKASCIGEIFAANDFYDYNAKYENAESKTGIVRDLDSELEQTIRQTAINIYQAMGCKGLSRVDFFLQEDNTLIFNELNTLPGFTSISMYPQLWEESGISYADLIDKLIELALED